MTRAALVMFFAMSALAQTAGMRSVYILPMAGGLDQYLAAQIAREHVMQVVADPKIADTVITDKLGDAFAQTLSKLHPGDEQHGADTDIHHTFQRGSSRGTVFLVDVKTRQVIWSDYEKPLRANSGGQLNREAGRIVKKMPKP